MRQWYRFNAQAGDTVAELEIFGDIGESFWDDNAVSARQFIDELKALPASVTTIRVKVNSLGGSVFDAVAIANALREEGRKGRTIETTVEGIAASAASVVIMAGERITMADNALVMIHNPWTCACGNAAEMRKLADTLDTIRDQIVATYRWHSALSAEALVALMDAETWMDADEAIANGFATDKVEGLKAAASIESAVLAKLQVPAQYQARVEAMLRKPEPAPPAPVAAPATDVLRLCREGGVSDIAEDLIVAGASLEQVQTRIASETQARAAAAARATEIRTLCQVANLPELSEGYIRGAMSIEDIRVHLTTVTAKLDKVEIDGNLDPDAGTRKRARISVTDTYARMNGHTSTKH